MRRNNPRLMINNLGMWAGMSAGFNKGSEMTEQTDNLSNNSTIMEKATAEWQKWAEQNNIHATNTTRETYALMCEAFMDGYLNGFTKRFTEGE